MTAQEELLASKLHIQDNTALRSQLAWGDGSFQHPALPQASDSLAGSFLVLILHPCFGPAHFPVSALRWVHLWLLPQIAPQKLMAWKLHCRAQSHSGAMLLEC